MRPVLILLIVLICTILGAAAGPVAAIPAPDARGAQSAERDTARAFPFYRRGLAFYAEGRTIEALRQFQNATFFDPNGVELRFAEVELRKRSSEQVQTTIREEPRQALHVLEP